MITDFWFKFKQFIRQSFCHHEYVYQFIPFKLVWICQKCGHEAKRKPANKLIVRNSNDNKE